jgi:hypothetical protein
VDAAAELEPDAFDRVAAPFGRAHHAGTTSGLLVLAGGIGGERCVLTRLDRGEARDPARATPGSLTATTREARLDFGVIAVVGGLESDGRPAFVA